MSKSKLDKLIELIEKQGKEIENLKKQLEAKEEAAPENPEAEPIQQEDHLNARNLVFGSCNEKYSIEKMIDLYNSNPDFGQARAQNYIRKFFAPLEDSPFFVKYSPNVKKDFTLIPRTKKDLDHFIGNFEKKDGDTFVWGASNFVLKKYHERFVLTCNPKINKICYKDEETGDNMINTFRGYLHKTPKKFNSYSENVKSGVKSIWNHIKEGWCSGEEDQFMYLKKWICKFVAGNKMRTGLYIKGIEGVGKSLIAEFLMFKVIGKHNCQVVCDPNCFLPGEWNDHLIGKLLVLLEEIPSSTSASWKCLYNSLKPWITNPVVEVKKRFISSWEIMNIATLILISNNKCINIGENDRRWFMPDVSMKYVGNQKYFNKLAKICSLDIIGEAFYWYCKEFFENNCQGFDEANPATRPQTKARTEVINDNLHTLYVFIKNEYLKKGKGLQANGRDLILKKFREKYLNELNKDKRRIKEFETALYRHHEAISPQEITRKLAEIGIKSKRKNTGMVVNVPYEDLREIFKQKQWLDEDHDEVDECTISDFDINLSDFEEGSQSNDNEVYII